MRALVFLRCWTKRWLWRRLLGSLTWTTTRGPSMRSATLTRGKRNKSNKIWFTISTWTWLSSRSKSSQSSRRWMSWGKRWRGRSSRIRMLMRRKCTAKIYKLPMQKSFASKWKSNSTSNSYSESSRDIWTKWTRSVAMSNLRAKPNKSSIGSKRPKPSETSCATRPAPNSWACNRWQAWTIIRTWTRMGSRFCSGAEGTTHPANEPWQTIRQQRCLASSRMEETEVTRTR